MNTLFAGFAFFILAGFIHWLATALIWKDWTIEPTGDKSAYPQLEKTPLQPHPKATPRKADAVTSPARPRQLYE